MKLLEHLELEPVFSIYLGSKWKRITWVLVLLWDSFPPACVFQPHGVDGVVVLASWPNWIIDPLLYCPSGICFHPFIPTSFKLCALFSGHFNIPFAFNWLLPWGLFWFDLLGLRVSCCWLFFLLPPQRISSTEKQSTTRLQDFYPKGAAEVPDDASSWGNIDSFTKTKFLLDYPQLQVFRTGLDVWL